MDFHGSLVVTMIMMIGAGTLGGETTEAKNPDHASLQGTWSIVSVASRGKKEAEDAVSYTFRLQGNDIFFLDGHHIEAAMNFKLDETQSPKQITFGMVQGIYEFKDNELHICYTIHGERPTMFKTTEDRPDEVLVILKKDRVPTPRQPMYPHAQVAGQR